MQKQQQKILLSCLNTQIESHPEESILNFYGAFQLGFFRKYEGLTIANAIRRCSLLDQPQYGITGVKIENIKHEYSCLPGVRETIFDILINLKKIVFYSSCHFTRTQLAFVVEVGPKILKAKHIQLPAFLMCVNPNQYITTLEIDTSFKMILFIEDQQIRNVAPSNKYYDNLYTNLTSGKFLKNQKIENNSHFLALDSQNTVVKNLNYTIKKSINNQELIVLDIWTNGSVHPNMILQRTIQHLLITLIPFYKLKNPSQLWRKPKETKNLFFHKPFIRRILSLDLSNFPLKINTYTQLYKLKIRTLSDLYEFTWKPKSVVPSLTNSQYQDIQNLLNKMQNYFPNL